jgi:Oxidoreductase family, NAD-binding Rossmann fold
MAEAPAYVILGRGRWAQKMRPIISGEGRSVAQIEETRQHPTESDSQYVERLASAMKASGTRIAWLCVSPGRHVCLMIQAAIEAGLHVVAEKPWYGSSEETQRLQSLARTRGRVIAVHFEYLVLREVEEWRANFHPGAGCNFGGRFFLSRSDKSGIPAMDNLGCHLLAIREYAGPSSTISEIRCGYELPDERLVWIDKGTQRLSSIDLFTHKQPIIQRFMQKVEAALGGAAFPFDLEFALRVAIELNTYKKRSSV